MYNRDLPISLQATNVKAQGLVYFQLANHKVDYVSLDWYIQARIPFKGICQYWMFDLYKRSNLAGYTHKSVYPHLLLLPASFKKLAKMVAEDGIEPPTFSL